MADKPKKRVRVYKPKKDRKFIPASGRANIVLRGDNGEFRKTEVRIERSDFIGSYNPFDSEAIEYLIIGFDTEFKTPVDPIPRKEVSSETAKYRVLSYQVHCSLFDPDQPDAEEWSGICYPDNGERLKLADIVTFAIWKGIESGAIAGVPPKIYLVGHFTRADVPAFADFQSLSEMVSSVRNTFLSVGGYVGVDFDFGDSDAPVKVAVIFRDTMLLTPATSKSLATLGDLVGMPKIVLDPDPVQEKNYKENMDKLLEDNPELFERYAINDAVICTLYLQQIIEQYEELLGRRKAPVTLSSIGVDLLIADWCDKSLNPLQMLGKEEVDRTYFSKKKGRYVKTKDVVYLREVHWHVDFVTEGYHGGRNEQFWFGPAFEDDWTDYDLAGAYPTAMALIGTPDWHNPTTSLKVADFTPTTFGFANVEFEFPKHVRYPTLPIRTENGLIFPRTGISDCSAPEIAVAHALGAKLKIRHGLIFPTDRSRLVFADFIRDCVERRRSYKPKTLKNLFWKELSNSTYGKTAQGLRKKRVFDSRDREMKNLPESKLTNPFYASYITSFVRAALGEVMNALPREVCVFSCTTDGFLTNATGVQIDAAAKGQIADLYRESRALLTGVPEMLEVKHRIRKPLGWRTRGQATLVEGTASDKDDENIVLAKGGIYTSISMDDVGSRNDFVVNLFQTRTPESRIEVRSMTGIRDIVLNDTDLVDTVTDKRLSMEYDWKCRPSAVWLDDAIGHVAFSTTPWETIDEFIEMRRYWDAYSKGNPRCIKTIDDFNAVAAFVMAQSVMTLELRRYIGRKAGADLRRLRQSLCLARRHGKAGLLRKIHGRTDTEFAELLVSVGIPCKPSDVENARKEKPFQPKNCPPTPDVLAALAALRSVFHSLDIEQFVADAGGIDMIGAVGLPNPFKQQSVSIAEVLTEAA